MATKIPAIAIQGMTIHLKNGEELRNASFIMRIFKMSATIITIATITK